MEYRISASFAGVIHGETMITGFRTGGCFSFECLDMLRSTLLTLPALENVAFDHTGQGPEEGLKACQATTVISLRELEFG
jgi:hypothetical protein